MARTPRLKADNNVFEMHDNNISPEREEREKEKKKKKKKKKKEDDQLVLSAEFLLRGAKHIFSKK